MSKTAVVHARMEPKTKQSAESILAKIGLTPTEAIRLFYHQISLRKGLPFQVSIPNKITAETLKKSQRGEELERFDSVDAAFAEWDT